MKSNFKGIQWDADFYNSLSDDECLVCLTERQVYIIGAIIGVVQWATRWIGDITGLDLGAIQDELEYRIAERMTCQNVTTLLNKIIDLELAIDNISNEIVPPESIDDPITMSFTDTYTEEEIQSFSATAETCDDAGKDAIYGAVFAIVNYIHAVNLDSLQELSQIGNVPDQIARFISATPIGIAPFDEAFDFAEFIVDELMEEYEATVDEELLESVRCDLFCIATANNCSLTWNDLIDYFGRKATGSGDIGSYAGTITNIMNFAITGTFTGDEYFYFLCLFQLVAVAVAEKYFDTRGIEYYSTIMKTGLNSPDNDWELLCVSCPTFYRILTHDFAYGMKDWSFLTVSSVVRGELSGGKVVGVSAEGELQYQIVRPFNPAWRLRAAQITFERPAGGGGTTIMRYRVTAGSNTGALNPSIANGTATGSGELNACQDAMGSGYITGINQAFYYQNANLGTHIRLIKVEWIFDVLYAPVGAVMTEQSNFGC